MAFTTPHYSKVFGTPTERLAQQLGDAHVAFLRLTEALSEIEFNARDYSDKDWVAAVTEREQVRQALTMVESYIIEHHDAACGY